MPEERPISLAEACKGKSVCAFYDSQDEFLDLATSFASSSPAPSACILACIPSLAYQNFLDLTQKQNIDHQLIVECSQFQQAAQEGSNSHDHTDPDAFIAYLDAQIEKALLNGCSSISVLIDVTALVNRFHLSYEELFKLESTLALIASRSNASFLCLYSLLNPDPHLILHILQIYPFIMIKNEIYENPCFLSPERFLASSRPIEAVEDLVSQSLLQKDLGQAFSNPKQLLVSILASLQSTIVAVIDTDGKFLFIAPRRLVKESFGFHPNSLIGSNLHDILPSDLADESLSLIRESCSSGKATKLLKQIKSPNCDFWYNISLTPLKGYSSNAVLAVLNDITELKNAHLQIEKANQELENLLKVKSNFALKVLHELRNPVTALQVGFDLLLGESSSLPRETRSLIAMLASTVEKLKTLIEDLSLIYSNEELTLAVEPLPIPVNDLIKRIISDNMRLNHGKEVRITAEGESFEVVADPFRLLQVLQTLIDNAIKYTHDPTIILIKTYTQNSHGFISVSDNGFGISPESLPHVFDSFYIASSQDSAETNGFGVGLSVCKELCQLMGGSISASSELGRGTTFTIQLPLAK